VGKVEHRLLRDKTTVGNALEGQLHVEKEIPFQAKGVDLHVCLVVPGLAGAVDAPEVVRLHQAPQLLPAGRVQKVKDLVIIKEQDPLLNSRAEEIVIERQVADDLVAVLADQVEDGFKGKFTVVRYGNGCRAGVFCQQCSAPHARNGVTEVGRQVGSVIRGMLQAGGRYFG
jgi:hypothetical protein